MNLVLIKISQATFRHREETFYENFNWLIREGEHWIITGNNGVGKTSLLHALSGTYFPIKGSIKYPFLEEQQEPVLSLRRKLIRVVSFRDDSRIFSPNLYFYQQRYNAFAADGTLTVWEYLIHAGFDERIESHLKLVKKTGIYPLLDRERIKLSSGQSRKLLITKALLQQPRILIIDNPYLGLDTPSRAEFNRLLDDLVQTEHLQLILSGQYEVLPNCINHCLVLDDFKKQYEGPLLQKPIISKTPNKASIKTQTALATIKSFYQVPDQIPDSIFNLQDVSVEYYGTTILKNINWHVQKGEKWALLGNNGSGKSTILSLLFGDHPQAYSNSIFLFGQKRGMGQSIWDIKKNIGFTSPELHYFFSYDISCFKTVVTGLFDHFYYKRTPTKSEQALIDALFDYFDIQHLKEQSFQKVSTGEQRIVLFIRALLKNPPLLLLDEPFQAFDSPTIEKARYLLDHILSPQHTLIFISHYQNELPSCVNSLAHLEKGNLSLKEV